MYRNTVIGLLCVLCLSIVVQAGIEEWGPATSGFIIRGDNTIEITTAGTYYFQAYNGSTAIDINSIYTSTGGVDGPVTVYVYQDPLDGNGVGAARVKKIDLSTATTGNLARLYISGNLADAGDIKCDNLTGNITAGGALGGHDIIVEGDASGNIVFLGGTGNITIADDCSGSMYLGAYNGGTIHIGNNLTGNIRSNKLYDVYIDGSGPHTGNITVIENAEYTHTLRIGSSPNHLDAQMLGNITPGISVTSDEYEPDWLRFWGICTASFDWEIMKVLK